MQVFRKSRAENSGAFPREDDSIVFVKLHSPEKSKVPVPEDEDATDQEETTPNFDMSSYDEDNSGFVDSVFAMDMIYAEKDADWRFANTEDIESDKIILLSSSSETTKKIIVPWKFRGRFRRSLKPLKKGWKKVTSWRQDGGAGRHTGMTDSQTEKNADSKRHLGHLNRSFSDWTGRKMAASHSAEHHTQKIGASSSSNDGGYESEFDAVSASARTGPAQFFPERIEGLRPCTTL